MKTGTKSPAIAVLERRKKEKRIGARLSLLQENFLMNNKTQRELTIYPLKHLKEHEEKKASTAEIRNVALTGGRMKKMEHVFAIYHIPWHDIAEK